MKPLGIRYLYALAFLILLSGWACGSEAAPVVSTKQLTQTQLPTFTQTPIANQTSQPFTRVGDMEHLFSAEVPADWIQSSAWLLTSASAKPGAPPDTLEFGYESPDRHGSIVFLEYDDRHKVTPAKLGDAARIILGNFFGKSLVRADMGLAEDGVDFTGNDPLPDGSFKLVWGLVRTKIHGTTYAYERGSTILVFSTFCEDAYSDIFANTFSHVTSTYKVP